MAATHRLALIIENPSNHKEFLLAKQSRPPKFNDEEYDSFVDSDLWDLPSVHLNPLQPDSEPTVEVNISASLSEEFNFNEFDIRSALDKVVDSSSSSSSSSVLQFWHVLNPRASAAINSY